MKRTFLSIIPPVACLRGAPSIARLHQDAFLALHGPTIMGRVVELGGEQKRDHARFFANAESYTVTNIHGEVDRYLDVTALDLADNSQDTFVCVSVLEHVGDVERAMSEMLRTLRPGGVLIAVVPFLYPIHDSVDVWRFAPDGWTRLLQGWDVDQLTHLGGRIASVANLLQRGAGRRNARTYLMKMASIAVAACLGPLDRLDDSPVAFGVIAHKPDARRLEIAESTSAPVHGRLQRLTECSPIVEGLCKNYLGGLSLKPQVAGSSPRKQLMQGP